MHNVKTLDDIDNCFVNMVYSADIVCEKLCELKDYFASDDIYNFCLASANLNFFTNSKNAYHNGLHTTRVLESARFLMLHEDGFDVKDAQLLFTAVLFHDYNHKGRVNEYFAEQEMIALDEFEKMAISSDVFTDSQIHAIKQIIYATETSENVKSASEFYQYMKDYNNLTVMKALMCEADILSSLTSQCGIENGELLAKEFENEKMATNNGRLYFLDTVSFVTKAAKKVGVNEYLAKEKINVKKRSFLKP